MKMIVILALSAFASLASAHSAYWECSAASGSNQAAAANCGSREHFDDTGRLGGTVGREERAEHGYGGYGHRR